MKRAAFSILEILVVMAIIMILVGVMTPVFKQVKRRGQITASMSNLRQMHLALKIYQSDHAGDAVYGEPSAMGFPPGEYLVLNRFGTPLRMWGSPCGQNYRWSDKPAIIQYDFFPYEVPSHKIADIAARFEENLLTFRDLNCSDDYEDLRNPLEPHRGLGVLLSGQAVNRRMTGHILTDAAWWAEPVRPLPIL